jgi:microcystin degradation protein MlrC
MARRLVLAMMMHETNTFSPLATPIGSFGRASAFSGDPVIRELAGTNTPLGGFIDLAREAGAEFSVPMAASAHPSGLVTNAAFEQMADAIVGEVVKGCDGVFLALHGAMVTETYDDGEGELLSRIRTAAPGIPIAVGLDFHTQLTAAMVDNATVITGYRTYPHVDMAETSRRAGRTLLRALDGEISPRMVWGQRGRGFRPGAERLGLRRLPASRYPASGALGVDGLRRLDQRRRNPAEPHPRHRLGATRGLPLPPRAPARPGGAGQDPARRTDHPR